MVQSGLEARETSVQGLSDEERKGVPQNGFLQFIEDKRGLFAGLSSGIKRLREEEQSWRNSPCLVTLLNEVVEIIRFGSPRTFDPKREGEFRRRYAEVLLGDTESPLSGDDTIQFRRGLRQPYGEEWDAWGERADQFAKDYQAVRKPIREATLEAKQTLLAHFVEYLSGEYAHLFDFRDFLVDSKFAAKRETVRHFLVSLAEHVFKTGDKKGNMLTQLQREWSDKTKNDVRDEILRSFLPLPMRGKGPLIKSVEKEGDKIVITGGGEPLAFLSFSALILRQVRRYKNITLETFEEEMTEEDLIYALKQIPLSEWPESLRNNYQKCSATTVASVIDEIRKGLEPYRR